MKTVRFQNTEQHLVWISMLENNIYRSNEEFPKSHSLSWSQKAQFFSAIIRIAFGNEV